MRPGIFVSRTREKLGRTCDQIGRTLEPCLTNLIYVLKLRCQLFTLYIVRISIFVNDCMKEFVF